MPITPEIEEESIRQVYSKFSMWGEIEEITFSSKAGARGDIGNHCFIKYAHRYYAEFAREAMND